MLVGIKLIPLFLVFLVLCFLVDLVDLGNGRVLQIAVLLQQNSISEKSCQVFLRAIVFKNIKVVLASSCFNVKFLRGFAQKNLLNISDIESCHDNVAKEQQFVVIVSDGCIVGRWASGISVKVHARHQAHRQPCILHCVETDNLVGFHDGASEATLAAKGEVFVPSFCLCIM